MARSYTRIPPELLKEMHDVREMNATVIAHPGDKRVVINPAYRPEGDYRRRFAEQVLELQELAGKLGYRVYYNGLDLSKSKEFSKVRPNRVKRWNI